jgi:phage/plasmid-like protein (TIGR03299 family)
MTHAIAFDKMFATVRKPAWHNLGTVLQDAIAPSAALQLIGADFEIVKTPLYTSVPAFADAQMMLPIADRFALMRSPIANHDDNWHFCGTVGAAYEIIQNADIARLLDPLAEQWSLETVGAMKDGQELFFTLSLGDWDVKGEQIKEFFLVHNATDGKTGLTLAYTPVRVVCQNTLVSGLGAARVKATMSHREGAGEELQMRMSLLADLQKAQLAGREAFRALSEIVLKADVIDSMLSRIYAAPKETARLETFKRAQDAGAVDVSESFRVLMEESASKIDRMGAMLVEQAAVAKQLVVKHNDEHPATANTAWAVYNAVVEQADFGGRMTENAPQSALFGGRGKTKETAFKLLSGVRK